MKERFDRYLIETNTIGIAYLRVFFDNDGTLLDFEYEYMNKAFARMTGLRANLCVGVKGSESQGLCSRGSHEFYEILSALYSSRQEQERDYYSAEADQYFKLKVISPEPDYCILSLRDITESVNRHLEDIEELKRSERTKATLLSNLPGMAYRCKFDPEWTMLFVSEGCYEMTGYRPESLVNNSVLSYNDLIHPEDRTFLRERWKRVVADRTVFRGEYRIKTAGGQVRWVYEQGQAIYGENGEIEAIEGLIIDINKQKMREERIEYLLRHDPLTGLYNRIQFEAEKKKLNAQKFLPLSIVIGDINGLKLVNEAFGSEEGDKLIFAVSRILKICSRPADFLARIGGDEFGVLMPNTSAEEANDFAQKVQRACDEHNQKGRGTNVNISLGYATIQNPGESFSVWEKVAEDYLYRHKLLERDSTCSTIISSIQTTMFERSHETKEHAERMAILSREVGQRLSLSQLELDDLALLATLHDVGKVVIDNGILMKPGDLSEEEWIEMRKHPEIGYRIASASSEMASIANGILSHHERWDGGGYPRGLQGTEIPLLARIISVVDAYDAMTEERIYRKAMTQETALEELQRSAGKQFDPEVVNAFSNFLQNRAG